MASPNSTSQYHKVLMREKISGQNDTGETERSRSMAWDLHSKCHTIQCENYKQKKNNQFDIT